MITIFILTITITICTILFWICSTFLATFDKNNTLPSLSIIRLCLSIIIPLLTSCFGYKRKSLSYSGTCIAFIFGFVITLSSYSFMLCMITFFISASKATKWRKHIKQQLDYNYKEGGQRNWTQVICNGGVAFILSVIHLIETSGSNEQESPIDFSHHYLSSWLTIAYISSVSCCCGDTFASEIGSVVGQPRLITSLKKVPRGTNGGISTSGLLASLFGGLLIGIVFFLSTFALISEESWSAAPVQWPIIFIAGLAGFFGSIIDSILGATLQFSGLDKKSGKVVDWRGCEVGDISGTELLSNDAVNLLSSLITAMVAPFVSFYAWKPTT